MKLIPRATLSGPTTTRHALPRPACTLAESLFHDIYRSLYLLPGRGTVTLTLQFLDMKVTLQSRKSYYTKKEEVSAASPCSSCHRLRFCRTVRPNFHVP